MKKFSKFISNHNVFILMIGLLLLIPSIFGYVHTKINYDILVYLPEDIETIQGENILTDEFGIGAYAFVMMDMSNSYDVLALEEKIQKIDGVNKVFSILDVIGTSIPKDMLPSEVVDKLYDDDTSIIMVTFDGSTSEDVTLDAVSRLRETVSDASRVSSMSGMVLDTRYTVEHEMLTYVLIAFVLCLLVLLFTTNSYVMPLFLLGNIGIAILYNMGSNIIFGKISYITQAISAVLQLGVTTDFSIFLYHKYEAALDVYKDKREAMAHAISETFKSVIGSSLTTFAGFLALCTMDLTLGTDIGLVMAKGVLFGLICVLTIFPALVLTFDKFITKGKHKEFLPQFRFLQKFALKKYFLIFVFFILLMIPAYYGNKNYSVYYKLDESLPSTLAFHQANDALASKFHIISPEAIIMDKNLPSSDVSRMVEELKKVDGIRSVMAPSLFVSEDLETLLPDEVAELFDNEKYQLVILNSTYEIASDELGKQIESVSDIVKKYDESAIVAGEGPLMKDLVTVADHDFHMVNYTSILVIFVIMLIVLQSISLPFILIFVIEFAIFLNMACSYFTGASLPFIASIVVGTIQLGATIDYAILMSTTYLENRTKCEREDKFKAMEKTLRTSIPSIITSALCFFAATVGVSLHTDIDMIGSICTLLARGSVISMLVVILVLPAMLLICDKVVLKTTRIKEEK